jgi:hypothetical protein
LGERLLCKQEVVGSIPIASTPDDRRQKTDDRSRRSWTGTPEGATRSPRREAPASFFDMVKRSVCDLGGCSGAGCRRSVVCPLSSVICPTR